MGKLIMVVANQTSEQMFPFSWHVVFAHILKALPQEGLKVRTADKVIGRVVASTRVSLLSWGENVSISLKKVDDHNTLLSVDCGQKVGFNAFGGHRNHKVVEKIILAVSRSIQSEAR